MLLLIVVKMGRQEWEDLILYRTSELQKTALVALIARGKRTLIVPDMHAALRSPAHMHCRQKWASKSLIRRCQRNTEVLGHLRATFDDWAFYVLLKICRCLSRVAAANRFRNSPTHASEKNTAHAHATYTTCVCIMSFNHRSQLMSQTHETNSILSLA